MTALGPLGSVPLQLPHGYQMAAPGGMTAPSFSLLQPGQCQQPMLQAQSIAQPMLLPVSAGVRHPHRIQLARIPSSAPISGPVLAGGRTAGQEKEGRGPLTELSPAPIACVLAPLLPSGQPAAQTKLGYAAPFPDCRETARRIGAPLSGRLTRLFCRSFHSNREPSSLGVACGKAPLGRPPHTRHTICPPRPLLLPMLSPARRWAGWNDCAFAVLISLAKLDPDIECTRAHFL